MEAAGYIASLFIGISLGLIGGGGSILTVPVLVYLFAVSPSIAVSYSLFVVGTTSLAGSFNYYRKGLVHFKKVALFGAPSIATVFLVRKAVLPLVPDVLFRISAFTVTYSLATMVVFALLMIAAAIAMIKSKEQEAKEHVKSKPRMLVAFGILIGLVTGFLGAGGGFLLIPALVMRMKLPMKEAIGTSLLITALNSAIGFLTDVGQFVIDWKFLLTVTAIAVTGIVIGSCFNSAVNGEKLKKGFGWFVLAMGIYIIIKEMVL